MPSIVILPLIVLSDLFRIDILFWLITLPIVAVLVCFLLWQYRQHQGLVSDMSVLNTVQHRNIEYDLVLKAMKLAVWHIDVQERTITYDADYRDALDVASIPPGSDVEKHD